MEQGQEPRARSSYLLDGRRVTIADLLDAGLLAVGDGLTYSRPRSGEIYRATVTASGKLALDDGQEFPSPSGAAMAAAGTGAVDGWEVWAVKPGKYLRSLRQLLLDRAAKGTTDESDAVGWNSQRRYEWLNEARGHAERGNPVELLVRDLFVLWGASSDGGPSVYQRIEADLANHGLTTSPNFRAVSLDKAVRFVIPRHDESDSDTPISADDKDGLYVGLTVGNIPSALSGVESVPPDATFDQAITKMKLNGYSQLAVLSGPHNLRGAVTWQSIAYARHANENATFADAIIHPRVARYDQELIEVLPELEAWDFIFVRDEMSKVAGIVTTADVVGTYRELSTPFILIGELDQMLRQIISRTFTLEEVTSLCNREGRRTITSFDDLEMGIIRASWETRIDGSSLGGRCTVPRLSSASTNYGLPATT